MYEIRFLGEDGQPDVVVSMLGTMFTQVRSTPEPGDTLVGLKAGGGDAATGGRSIESVWLVRNVEVTRWERGIPRSVQIVAQRLPSANLDEYKFMERITPNMVAFKGRDGAPQEYVGRVVADVGWPLLGTCFLTTSHLFISWKRPEFYAACVWLDETVEQKAEEESGTQVEKKKDVGKSLKKRHGKTKTQG